jgi:putative transposase
VICPVSDYVYIWADGVYVNVRLPGADGHADRLCLLVIVGVRPDGRKELVAVADGHREDTQSWLEVLRDLRDRGMRAPELATGDGALGFWAALRQVFPQTRAQRCWVHYGDRRIMWTAGVDPLSENGLGFGVAA